MPARHKSLQDDLLLEADFKSDSSGRRKRVSARHQVKRLDRTFEELALLENRSGRRNRFSSFGADLQWSAISPAVSKPNVKSGPDVFADALVPRAGAACAPGALISPNPDIHISPGPRVGVARKRHRVPDACGTPVPLRRAGTTLARPGDRTGATTPLPWRVEACTRWARCPKSGHAIAPMVIVSRNGRVNRIPRTRRKSA